MAAFVKLVVTVPVTDGDAIREAVGKAGCGKIGEYSFCSFSSIGTGRFLPGTHAHPTIGTVGVPTEVAEERIEFTCEASKLESIIRALREAHPYEEPAIDIYQLLNE